MIRIRQADLIKCKNNKRREMMVKAIMYSRAACAVSCILGSIYMAKSGLSGSLFVFIVGVVLALSLGTVRDE